MTDAARTQKTDFFERWRALSSGMLETAGSTFLLLIAVRWYGAGPLAKGLVAAGGSVGLLLSLSIVPIVMSTGLPASKAASILFAFGAASFLVSALLPTLPVFVICSIAAMACSAASIPLFTQMYQENYPEQERGRRLSRTFMIRIGTAALFSNLAGEALSGQIEYFWALLLIFSGAMAFASFCLGKSPTEALTREGGAHPLRALRFVREDALFRRTLICWMLMGFANLMMLPLRVEYLANPVHKLALPVETIALLTGVVPNLARLVMSPIWGHLFDRMNFFALRIMLNTGFAIGILTFFTSNTLIGMMIGAVVFGISNAGGDVAWSLWVTKFAPPHRVADYMSVHTFLTGVRGVLAPLVGFYLINRFAVTSVAAVSGTLILAATLLLIPEIKFGRRAPKAAALVEEVSE
jgi:MFS family permease